MKKINLNVEVISQAVMQSIDEIEEKIGYKIMFGAVGGSYSMGLQSGSSDIDFYLIVDKERLCHAVHQKIGILIQGEQITIDFMCVSYQEILREIEKYKKTQKYYPTVIYRTEEEKRKNIGKGDMDRPDFKRSLLFRILLSDKVINKELAETKYTEYMDGIRIVDIVDYHYTRIYGNYNEKIRGMDFVPIRKYLYTIHEICTCKCLMLNIQKPPMDFSCLLDGTVTDILLKDKIGFLYEKNRQAVKDKKKELVDTDETINRFISESLNTITGYLKEKGKDSDCLCF